MRLLSCPGWVRAAVHWLAAWFVFMPPRVRVAGRAAQPMLVERPGNARGAVLYFHGNAGLASIPPWLRVAADGLAIYAPEYPGYGAHATARPSEAGVHAAADAAYAAARADGFAPEAIYAWGNSLGGAAAAHLAARRPLGGLVMHAAFASVFTVVAPWAAPHAPPVAVEILCKVHALTPVPIPLPLLQSHEDRLIRLRDHCLPNLAAVPHANKRVWRMAGPHNAEPPRTMALDVLLWLQSGYEL